MSKSSDANTAACVSNTSNRDAEEHSVPSRCESPLLPMGEHSTHQVDPDRLSQQLGRTGNRQSQQSMLHKSYAIPEDMDEEDNDGAGVSKKDADDAAGRPRHHIRRPRKLPRPKSYRIHTSGAHESAREFSSKFKSACRKLNPRRLAKPSHHARDDEPSSPVSGNGSGFAA
ncbi:hypothetical protein IWW36_005014 [Coemansia brasiliensis]|uniref:Uncharacterized protein n=1 Tax=Coemansia brasiliensis TaxID=2650707 RepID=A0A9W8LX29_9FUNG|nr:hypothetical protein IWW36_005014 [Coemansia brasiliensis]